MLNATKVQATVRVKIGMEEEVDRLTDAKL